MSSVGLRVGALGLAVLFGLLLVLPTDPNIQLSIIVIITFFALFFVLARITRDTESYYSTVTIFGLGCLIYYLMPTVEILLRHITFIRANGVIARPDYNQLEEICVLTFIAFISFFLGYRLSGFRLPTFRTRKLNQTEKLGIPRILVIFTLISVGILLLAFRTQIQSSGTYKGNYTTISEDSIYGLLVNYAAVSLVLTGTFLFVRGRRIGLLLIVLVAAWAIYSFNRNPLLMAFCGGMAILALYRGFTIRFLVFGAVSLVVGLAIMTAVTLYRSNTSLQTALSGDNFMISRVDPLGPYISLERVIGKSNDFLYGRSYFEVFFLIIPKFIWPERPDGIAQTLAKTEIANWNTGQGLGYSLLAESYRNFAWAGAFIQYFGIGLGWGLGWRFIRRVLWYLPALQWQLFYQIFGFYLLFLMHRAPLSTTIKSAAIVLLPLILLSLIFDQARLRRQKFLEEIRASSEPRATARQDVPWKSPLTEHDS